MKKLLAITAILIIAIFSTILYRKYNTKINEKASETLVKDMTLVSNKECEEFYISNEITNALYNYITGHTTGGEDDNPVTNVSWYDAITFCNELSIKNELKPAYILKSDHIYLDKESNGYRLPTAKEWECASNSKKTNILEWTYDYDENNEIYRVIKGSDESNNMLPSSSSDNVSFKIVKSK